MNGHIVHRLEPQPEPSADLSPPTSATSARASMSRWVGAQPRWLLRGPCGTGFRRAGCLRLGQVPGLQHSHEDEVFPAVWVQPGFTADPLLAETAGQIAVDRAAVAGQHLQFYAVRTQHAE